LELEEVWIGFDGISRERKARRRFEGRRQEEVTEDAWERRKSQVML